MSIFRYFKHKNENSLATQSSFTDELTHIIDEEVEYFEVQIEISGVMRSKLIKYKVDDWCEITNDQFINLITKLGDKDEVGCKIK